jgi:hypothetical protein
MKPCIINITSRMEASLQNKKVLREKYLPLGNKAGNC